jgi:uncharacterized protein YecE (DUF72 family)
LKPVRHQIVSIDHDSFKSGIIFSGTSGLVFEEANKKSFPILFQTKPRLSYYASLFNSLEVNSSFYKMPRFQTYAKWSEEVPEDFAFTVKLWQGITHVDKYQDAKLEMFIAAIAGLGDKKGCLLIQYPAMSKTSLRERERLLKHIHQLNSGWALAIEIRNRDWLNTEFYSILEMYNACLVYHDMRKADMLSLNSPSSFRYLRFHGPNGDYKGSYTEDFMLQQAQRIRCWKQQGKNVYVYFNNTIGDAFGNLKTLRRMIASD